MNWHDHIFDWAQGARFRKRTARGLVIAESPSSSEVVNATSTGVGSLYGWFRRIKVTADLAILVTNCLHFSAGFHRGGRVYLIRSDAAAPLTEAAAIAAVPESIYTLAWWLVSAWESQATVVLRFAGVDVCVKCARSAWPLKYVDAATPDATPIAPTCEFVEAFIADRTALARFRFSVDGVAENFDGERAWESAAVAVVQALGYWETMSDRAVLARFGFIDDVFVPQAITTFENTPDALSGILSKRPHLVGALLHRFKVSARTLKRSLMRACVEAADLTVLRVIGDTETCITINYPVLPQLIAELTRYGARVDTLSRLVYHLVDSDPAPDALAPFRAELLEAYPIDATRVFTYDIESSAIFISLGYRVELPSTVHCMSAFMRSGAGAAPTTNWLACLRVCLTQHIAAGWSLAAADAVELVNLYDSYAADEPMRALARELITYVISKTTIKTTVSVAAYALLLEWAARTVGRTPPVALAPVMALECSRV